jgi:Cu(I)/Ag(I) efflux system membrane fusion protein
MKNALRITAIVIASAGAGAGAGAWISHELAGSSANPAEGEPGHRHVPVKMKDAQGKTYYSCAMHPQVHADQPGACPICGMTLIKRAEVAPADRSSQAMPREPLYWYDPMKPDQHFDKPGKSPFMDMQLVPKYSDAGGAEEKGIVSIAPGVVQNLGIRTSIVEQREVSQEVRAVASIAVNENRIEVVQTRVAGWVERLSVRAQNEFVKKGQLLAEIYSPELFAAQQEFALALRADDAALITAGRQRLMSIGLDKTQIARLEKTGEPQRRVGYYAPTDGVITELGIRAGAQVSPGMTLYTLADLSQVWINAEVPEAQAAGLQAGAPVRAMLSGLSDRTFDGRIDYVVPEVDLQTRTVKVRAVIDNKDGALKPGMFAEVLLGSGSRHTALMVASESLIRTGTRTMVIVAESAGRYRPTEVKAGSQRDGFTEVLEGLQAGQNVVSSGQFLIDSEANLRGAFNKLDASSAAETAP